MPVPDFAFVKVFESRRLPQRPWWTTPANEIRLTECNPSTVARGRDLTARKVELADRKSFPLAGCRFDELEGTVILAFRYVAIFAVERVGITGQPTGDLAQLHVNKCVAFVLSDAQPFAGGR